MQVSATTAWYTKLDDQCDHQATVVARLLTTLTTVSVPRKKITTSSFWYKVPKREVPICLQMHKFSSSTVQDKSKREGMQWLA